MADRGDLLFDGFISYSHAADDLLAPRLQGGLQRFAKPWWRRRALRIFRDESSLSANPHLWGSIVEALENSSWFVLLLSPDAAQSVWVDQEVGWWVGHKDRERLIPVVTDGEFSWSDGDVAGDAVPASLRGVFSEEPRWVDLRWARGDEQLDLNNPRFSSAVADIASAIRGVPKDELESEEVRQHRRTVRTAWGAAIGLVGLLVAASVATVYAVGQRGEAQAQALLAVSERDRAVVAEQDAESRRVEAEAARAEAEAAAEFVQAREIVLEAEKAVGFDPELSIHLALYSLEAFQRAGEDPAPAVGVLRAAIAADRVVARMAGGSTVATSPDGRFLATTVWDAPWTIAVLDRETGTVVERYRKSDANDYLRLGTVAFSGDGELLAASGWGGQQSNVGGEPKVWVWRRDTGEARSIDSGPTRAELVFSPDGRYLAWTRDEGEGSAEGIAVVWSLEEDRMVYESTLPGWCPDFRPDGLLSHCSEGGIRIVDLETGSARTIETGFGVEITSWSPDGSRIAVSDYGSVVVVDAASGVEVAQLEVDGFDSLGPPLWLPGGDALVVGGRWGLGVFDAANGQLEAEFLGVLGGSHSYGVIEGTPLIAAAWDHGSEVVVLDASVIGGTELGGWSAPLDVWGLVRFIDPGSRVVLTGADGSYVTARWDDGLEAEIFPGSQPGWPPFLTGDGRLIATTDPSGQWVVRSTESDSSVFQAPDGWMIQGVDETGSTAVIHSRVDPTLECEQILLVETATGRTIGEMSFEECYWNRRFHFSSRGDMFVSTNNIRLFDSSSGGYLGGFAGNEYRGLATFGSGGTRLVVGSDMGVLAVFDVDSLVGSNGSHVPLVRVDAHDGTIIDLAVSPDESMAATSALSEPVRVWDLMSGRLLWEFGGNLEGPLRVAFHPSLPHLMVVSQPNQVRIYTVDMDELVGIAEASLTREMTEQECQQYFRASCDEAGIAPRTQH